MKPVIKDIDNFLYSHIDDSKKAEYADRYVDHYLEQYRMYLHIFNNTSDRRLKSNDFFLGLNTAIIGALGYIETKEMLHSPILYALVPFIGIIICFCWLRFINSYRQLNRAKFEVIHAVEKKLPIALFQTEWELLGKMKDKTKYIPLSKTERIIPITFIVLYITIFLAKLPWATIFSYFK